MKILFITHYYPPEIGAAANRIGYFAQYLAKNGHEVSVLTCAPNYPEGKIYEGHQNKFSVHTEHAVTVFQTRILLSSKKSSMSRLAHYFSFIVSGLIAKRKIPKPDVIIATMPPLFVGILGVLFKKSWKIPLIADVRDLWPESVQSVGAVKNRPLLRQGASLAHWIYNYANHLTATSPGIQQGLPSSCHKKTTVLPNGAELELFEERGATRQTSSEEFRKKWNIAPNAYVVLYTGNLGLAQAPEVLLKTAQLMHRQPHSKDVVFLIVGGGVLLEKMRSEADAQVSCRALGEPVGSSGEAKRNHLTNVTFTGPQPRLHMPNFLAAADVCIIPYKAAETFRHTLPSKMFDAMAGAKPLIINLKGEGSELIVQQAQCGLLAEEENPHSLAEKILELKNNPSQAEKLGKNGRAFVEKYYQREVISMRLAALLSNISTTR